MAPSRKMSRPLSRRSTVELFSREVSCSGESPENRGTMDRMARVDGFEVAMGWGVSNFVTQIKAETRKRG